MEIRWSWIVDHLDDIGAQLVEHVQLTVIAVVVGLAISLPVAILAHRRRVVYPAVTFVAGLLYTIPSLALFVLLVPFTGLSIVTAEIGLVSYTLLILIRNIVIGLRSVPDEVRDAARGMGYTAWGMLLRIELPLALPAIVAGIRIATVTTIGLVTVTALIGLGGLGRFILNGLQTFFATPTLVGAVLSVVLALAADALLLVVQRSITPWSGARAR
jgi:osmoprotectant transport system permease protein